MDRSRLLRDHLEVPCHSRVAALKLLLQRTAVTAVFININF